MNRIRRIRYLTGLVLLILNYPVGLGGLWIGGVLFLKTKAYFWIAVGSGCYLTSWVMLIAGFFLAGNHGVLRLKFFIRRTRKRLQLLHLRVNNEKSSDTTGTGL